MWICKVHELTHTDNKRHVCPTCGKKYADIRCFQKHVAAHTLPAAGTPTSSAAGTPTSYQCGICQAVFPDLRSLRSHNRLQHGHSFQTPAVDQSYFCGQCGKELTVQTSSRQEIVLSANCSCSGEIDVDGAVDDIIGSDEINSVIHGTVNVPQLDNAAAKVELPDELLNAWNYTLCTWIRGVFRGVACTCPPPKCEFLLLIFNVKNYAKIWTLLEMYTWNVPLGPFRFLNTPLTSMANCCQGLDVMFWSSVFVSITCVLFCHSVIGSRCYVDVLHIYFCPIFVHTLQFCVF